MGSGPSIARRPGAAGLILVVDDDLSIRLTISEILRYEGYSVDTAANGADALEALDRVQPSLILLDMRMPVLDGWEFARELQRRSVKLPILVMSAAQNAGRWAAEIGAQGYLAKPFDLPDLLRAVDEASAFG